MTDWSRARGALEQLAPTLADALTPEGWQRIEAYKYLLRSLDELQGTEDKRHPKRVPDEEVWRALREVTSVGNERTWKTPTELLKPVVKQIELNTCESISVRQVGRVLGTVLREFFPPKRKSSRTKKRSG